MNCWALGRRGSLSPRYTKIRHTNLGNKRIKFCSSESCTSRTRYSKDSGKRGRTEKASLTSRMQTLCAGTARFKDDVCKSQVMKGGDAYMCEMPSSLSEVKFFETWKGPSRRPGRISWHWCRMSYLRLDSGSATDFWDTGAVRRTSTRHLRVPVSAHGVLENWVQTWKCLGGDTGCCRVVGRNERRVDSEAVSKGMRDSNP